MSTGPPLRLLPGWGRMNLRDVSAGELYHGRNPSVSRVWIDEHDGAGRLCLRQRPLQVFDFVAGQFAPVRIRKVTIGDEHCHLSERRFDADAPERVLGSADLDPGGMRIIGDD